MQTHKTYAGSQARSTIVRTRDNHRFSTAEMVDCASDCPYLFRPRSAGGVKGPKSKESALRRHRRPLYPDGVRSWGAHTVSLQAVVGALAGLDFPLAAA